MRAARQNISIDSRVVELRIRLLPTICARSIERTAHMHDGSSALALVLGGDAALYAIVKLSLMVSLAATALAATIALPLGAFLALVRFPGRTLIVVIINAFMGLPPVVVGLAVYLLLSRSGPLGFLGILFSPQAMVIA